MINHIASHSSPRRCRGVVIEHRRRWWLVEFPNPGGDPAIIHHLTGHYTRAMTDRIAANAGNADGNHEVGSLESVGYCWSGEFLIAPSDRAPDEFDLDACLGGAKACIEEIRLARITIESSQFPLAVGFASVLSAVPREDRPVLAVRLSGYIFSTFELLTARYMPTYRPKSPWRDLGNNAVGDSGSDILGWRYANDWIQPA